MIEAKSIHELADFALSLDIPLDEAFEGQVGHAELLEIREATLDVIKRLVALLFSSLHQIHDHLVLISGALRQSWTIWTSVGVTVPSLLWPQAFNFLIKLSEAFPADDRACIFFFISCPDRRALLEHIAVVFELFLAVILLLNDSSGVEHTPGVVDSPAVVLNGPEGELLLLIIELFARQRARASRASHGTSLTAGRQVFAGVRTHLQGLCDDAVVVLFRHQIRGFPVSESVAGRPDRVDKLSRYLAKAWSALDLATIKCRGISLGKLLLESSYFVHILFVHLCVFIGVV